MSKFQYKILYKIPIVSSNRVATLLKTNTTQQTRGAGPMLVYRLRRWPNLSPKLFQRLVFAGEKI